VLASLVVMCVGCVTTLPNGIKLTTKSMEASQSPLPDGRFEENVSGTLAEDFVAENGMVLKKGTHFWNSSEDGSGFILATDWTHPEIGYTIKADTEVLEAPGGRLYSLVLAKDWRQNSTGMVFKAGMKVQFWEEGTVYRFTLAENWKSPENGMVYKAGEEMRTPAPPSTHGFTQDRSGVTSRWGNFRIVLAEDWMFPGSKMLVAANREITFHKNASYASFALAKDWVHPTNGMILKSGTGVQLSENGSIVKATLAKPWKDPATGKQYQADTEYAFK
jgi:hypothetical protein